MISNENSLTLEKQYDPVWNNKIFCRIFGWQSKFAQSNENKKDSKNWKFQIISSENSSIELSRQFCLEFQTFPFFAFDSHNSTCMIRNLKRFYRISPRLWRKFIETKL